MGAQCEKWADRTDLMDSLCLCVCFSMKGGQKLTYRMELMMDNVFRYYINHFFAVSKRALMSTNKYARMEVNTKCVVECIHSL